ncbi:MAG: beta-lactamase family protein [Sedimentisphaerales bacterium]|nr:beta-lactamase family protein [Sedimentisphaerales bacterium]
MPAGIQTIRAAGGDTIPAAGSETSAAEGAPAVDANDLQAKVDAIVQPLVDGHTNLGVAVGLIRQDQTLVSGYGQVVYGVNRRPDADTVYEIGSISKVFTGTLLAWFVQTGRLALDDPAETLLPDSVRVPAYETRKITLQDLSSHVSGLPRMPTNFAPRDPYNPYADYGEDDLYRFLSGHTLRRRPGETYEYSNLGAGLLGAALARKSGMTYEQLLIERICAPLGMDSTRIALTPAMRRRLAPPYTTHGYWKLRIFLPDSNWDIPTLAGAGGIRSTVNDLLKFLAANLGPIQTDLQAAGDLARQERFKISDTMSIGLGWHIFHFPDFAEPIYWHNGGTGGYRTFMGFLRQQRLAVVLLSNTQSSVDGAALDLLRALKSP